MATTQQKQIIEFIKNVNEKNYQAASKNLKTVVDRKIARQIISNNKRKLF
jgi:hypothetical protein